jgi:hypothetical protein
MNRDTHCRHVDRGVRLLFAFFCSCRAVQSGWKRADNEAELL